MRDDDLPELTPDEERLLDLLVEYDEALADGTCRPELRQHPQTSIRKPPTGSRAV